MDSLDKAKKAFSSLCRWVSRTVLLRGPWFVKPRKLAARRLLVFAPFFSIVTERRGLVSRNTFTIANKGDETSCIPALVPAQQPKRIKRVIGIIKKILIAASLVVWYIHVIFVLSTSLAINCYRWMTPKVTTLALYRKYSSKFKVLPAIPAAFKTIPKYIRSMLIAVEDYKFYEHNGFDMEGIQRAIEINKRIKKNLYGGSTITMQTARTLFLIPEKSYLRKYLEAIITVELELFLTKDRILELYFSWAEWGKGIFGLEQAAQYYYKCKVRMLGRDEAARLIAVLSSPILNTPKNLERNRLLAQRYSFLVLRYVN